MDTESVADRMLDALLSKMPPGVAAEARAVRDLLMVSGCPRGACHRKVVELFSPPRVTKELGTAMVGRACPNLTAGSTFDLCSDESGGPYDFRKAGDRQRCRERIRAEQPWLVIGSPPCTWWSSLMAINIPRMEPAEASRREAEAKVLLHFACEIYRHQLAADRHFLHEHPASARSWADGQVRDLLEDPRVQTVVGHQCRYGQRARTADGRWAPAKKATRWMSSAPAVLERLGLKCRGGHAHQALVGGRAGPAAVYPPQLCRAILRGAEKQRELEGRPTPEAVVAELALLGLDRESQALALASSWSPAGSQATDHEAPVSAPASAGSSPLGPLRMHPSVVEGRLCHEQAGLAAFQATAPVLDEYTGDVLPAELVRRAREEEVSMMEDWDVWDVTPMAEARRLTGKAPLKGRWVDCNKGDRGQYDVRCRWVAKDIAYHHSDQFFAATPPLEALRLVLSEAATGVGVKKVMFLDAKKAHLHAPSVRDVCVELPPERARPGFCCRLKRCLYGTRDAPQQWERFAAEALTRLGFRKGVASPVCFHHPGRCLAGHVHGDDFVFCGKGAALAWVAEELGKTILLKVVGVLGGDPQAGDVQEARCLNRVIRWSPEGIALEADPRHAELLAAMLGRGATALSAPGCREPGQSVDRIHETGQGPGAPALAGSAGRLSAPASAGSRALSGGAASASTGSVGRSSAPASAGSRAPSSGAAPAPAGSGAGSRGTEPLPTGLASMFRAGAARANYLAMDRPDVAFAAKELCRRMSAPCSADLAALQHLARYLLGSPRQVYQYRWQPEAALDVYADTDWAGCSETRRSTSGGCALRGSHLIKHWATTQKVVTLSSGEAELAGVVKAASEGLGLQSVARDFGLAVEVRLHTDSSAALGIVNRSGIGKVRHLAVSQLWVQEKLRDGTFTLYKCRGEMNPADLFTKHLDQVKIKQCLKFAGVLAEAGRAESAPCLAAEVEAFLAALRRPL